MANTLPDIKLPENLWVDLYAATGIAVGTALDIWNKGNNNAVICIASSAPTRTDIGVPIWAGVFEAYRSLTAGEAGAWAYSELGTSLSVQEA